MSTQSEADALLMAGAMLSNIAFNLSQHPGRALTQHECDAMKRCQKDWDAARAALTAKAPEVQAVRDSIDVSRDEDGDLCIDFRGPAFTASVSVPDGSGIVSVAWSVGQYRGTASMAKPDFLPAAPGALPEVRALTEEQIAEFGALCVMNRRSKKTARQLLAEYRDDLAQRGIPSAPTQQPNDKGATE